MTYGGVGELEIAQRLAAASDPIQVQSIRDELGLVRYDPQRIEKLDNFIIHFFSNLRGNSGRPEVPGWIAPPLHLHTSGDCNLIPQLHTIEAVQIRFRDYF